MIILIIFGVSGISALAFKKLSSKVPFPGNPAAIAASADTSSIQDLIQKDSDGDGVPDWEEALWGTDPNNKETNKGVADADWIAQRKKDLAASGDLQAGAPAGQNLTETQKFSREFFATVTALKQSGNLDDAAVSNISNVLGDKIKNSDLADNYTVIDIKKTYDVTKESQANFYETMKQAYLKYRDQGIGDEFDSVDPDAGTTDAATLAKIGQAYQDFSKDAQNLKVPSNLVQNELDIINSAYNTGQAVKNLAKMADDPLVGLTGLSQYQKYSEQFVNSSEDLRTYLIDSGIIKG